jgi:hypothetical protein
MHLNWNDGICHHGGARTMAKKPVDERWLDIEEVRLVADLRIMHAKVHELYEIVSRLKGRHKESAIRAYADHAMLSLDIERVDDIYLWFISLKENGLQLTRKK